MFGIWGVKACSMQTSGNSSGWITGLCEGGKEKEGGRMSLGKSEGGGGR